MRLSGHMLWIAMSDCMPSMYYIIMRVDTSCVRLTEVLSLARRLSRPWISTTTCLGSEPDARLNIRLIWNVPRMTRGIVYLCFPVLWYWLYRISDSCSAFFFFRTTMRSVAWAHSSHQIRTNWISRLDSLPKAHQSREGAYPTQCMRHGAARPDGIEPSSRAARRLGRCINGIRVWAGRMQSWAETI